MFISKELLLESAEDMGSIAKINYMFDELSAEYEATMLYAFENDDYDLYQEAEEAQKQGIVSLIKTIFTTIKDMILSAGKKIKDFYQTAKIKTLMSSESRALLKAAKAGKVEGPDISKLAKLVKKSKDFISKYCSNVKKFVDKDEITVQDAERVLRYHAKAMKEYDKIINEFEKVRDRKVKLTGDKIMEALKEGIDVGKAQDQFAKEMDGIMNALTKSANAVITKSQKVMSSRKVNKILNESVKDKVSSIASGAKNLFKRVANSISNFVSKHRALINSFGVVLANIAVAAGIYMIGRGDGELRGYKKGKTVGFNKGYERGASTMAATYQRQINDKFLNK